MTARDRGLALISRINRWMIAGAVALSALISVVAAKSFHGRTVQTSATSNTQSSASSSSSSSSGASSGGGIQQPAETPAAPASSGSGAVVSGGS